MKRFIVLFSIVLIFSYNNFIYAQNCEEGFTYLQNIPDNINNVSNSNYCFNDNNLNFLDELFNNNQLDSTGVYNLSLELGPQIWVEGHITSLVLTYIQGGNNGITSKISEIPESVGLLTELSYFQIDKHNITQLPVSISQLHSLTFFKISNNWLTSLPDDIGNLINLVTLDLGYNQLESIPQSIGNLENIQYLFLFNNNLSGLPNTICNLNLPWSGISSSNYPYFACGGNNLCSCDLIPDCVINSSNVNISMEQNYYSFLLEINQDCCGQSQSCTLTSQSDCLECNTPQGDINGDNGWNVLDIVGLANCVLDSVCFDCAADMNSDGGFNVLDIVALANCVLSESCS